ncbi:MAG: lactate utilization protein [Bryobacterales bacterium]|nr:lactate utilization protein [Bryobacterales bacterium]
MTSRQQILNDVRKALGRAPGQPPAAQPQPRIVVPQISTEDRIRLFQERLEVLGGKVHRAPTYAHASSIVAGLIENSTAVASNALALRHAGITSLPNVSSGYTDEPSLRAACTTAPFGITGADYGLAETGSIVTIAAHESRLVSLLPPVHIALLSAHRLLTGLDEFYTLHPLPASKSASTVFITGPSRSADIEMILVRGVHGPRVIHVIVIDEELI